MGGKVLVSTQEHIQRLIAIRRRAQFTFGDPIDHPHIKGVTIKGVEPLYEAMRKGTDKDWEERSGCMTFPDAEYSKRGAAAYVQMIQRKERENKVETLTHQKWSGSEIVDEMGNIVSGGLSSTGIMSAGAMDGAMRPPPVPQKAKRSQVAPPADEPAPKRIELGDELPDEVETLTETSLKRMHLQFERKVKLNRELRIKHVDDPDKFLKSEVDLDEEIKKFTLVGMLNHVNTDIAVDVFEVLSELTDPEVLSEVEDPEGFAIFDAQLCQMTVDVLARIDETVSDEDFKAVTNGLSMIENLADLMPQETCRQFLEIPTFLPWLIKRLRAQGMDYNKVYASEILGIVLQNSERARDEMVKLEGVDKLLRGIAAYRKRDPADSEDIHLPMHGWNAASHQTR
eukprot:s522_g24.t1